MKASLEIDLLLHFGFYKNVNLLSRGIYRIKVSLVCGSQKIIPVGMFAAPSTFHSSVDQQEIETVGMITPAEVDEEQHCFVGRAIAIRYKGEKHELNEGVHWRFTLPNVDLGNQVQGPKLNQLLGVKFELQFCDFLDENEAGASGGLSTDFRRYIPIDPQFETVSTQRLMIQSLTSGLHQLYAVSFDGDHFSSLDAMFHACISSVHYTEFHHNSILPAPDGNINMRTTTNVSYNADESTTIASSSSSANVTSPTPTPTKSRRMSTTIEKERSEPASSSRTSIFKFLASPEKLLFGSNNNGNDKESKQKGGPLLGLIRAGTSSSQPLDAPSTPIESSSTLWNCIPPNLPITEEQALKLFKLFVGPVVLNYQRAIQQSQFIINNFVAWSNTTAGSNTHASNTKNGKHIFDIDTYNQDIESMNNVSNSKCVLLVDDATLFTVLKSCTIFQDLANEVNRNIDICNTILSLRWTLIVNSLKHIMQPVKKYLKRGFIQETAAFWKQQQLIHTRNIGGAHHLTSNKDEDVLETLTQHIKFERDNDIVACNVREQLRDEDGFYSSTTKTALPVYARGMSIFDTETHMIPSRLPYLFVEEYIPDPSETVNRDETKPKLSTPNPYMKLTTFRGIHVIFLQHGFMGTSYDMRQIGQVLNMLCPDNTLVYSLKANELCGQESIQDMADKLASEIFDYCADRAPMVLEEKNDRNQCRVSFIGHSLGSVMIRLALQNPNLSFLRNKLHLFVSLASPHIGNLFSDSQLVSTGMWALSKFKNCQSLKELVLEDSPITDNADSQSQKKEKDKESSLLYSISKYKTFSLFQKIILVSCPKDQYVPFYSARIQTTPKIVADATTNGLSSNGGLVSSMVHNLLDCLQPHQLIRVTVMNYNPSIHVPPRFDDKAAKSGKERKHDTSSTNNVASLLLKENDTTVFDVNNMIGRSAHICYLESPVVAFQLILSLQKYFVNDQMPQ